MPFRSDLKTPAKDRSDDRRPRGRPSAVACAGSTLHKKPGQPNDRWMVNLASSSAYSRGSLVAVGLIRFHLSICYEVERAVHTKCHIGECSELPVKLTLVVYSP